MIHLSTQTASRIRDHVALALVLAFWLPPFGLSTGLAQEGTGITPTIGVGSLGTTVMADGNTVQITGGTRPGDGTNLFHSFDQFSVGPLDTAQFLNTTPSLHTSNILGRVTGESPSSIFGAIDTMSYPGANLFLMNPNGIVFGSHATLHVGGLVAFTTANYLRLAEANGSNAGIFHAETTSTSLLTSASVAAFGFLGSNPAAIAVQGSTLEMQPGQSISLVGGNLGFKNPDAGSTSVPNGVTVTNGQLLAPGGQVHIASVASPGEITAGALEYAPNINGQSFGALGTIQISQQSSIDTSGEGGGTILIRGGRLVVDDSTISANTVGPDTGPYAGPFGAGIDIQVAQDAIIDNGAVIETNAIGPVAQDRGSGGVRITADHLEISGEPKILAIEKTNAETIPFAGIRSNIESNSTAARSGDISLNATSIQIKDLGKIETQTASAGNAGHIILSASGNIDIDFADVQSFSNLENSSGHSGNITLSSSQGNVSLTDTTVTSQSGDNSANAGHIAINAPQGNILLAGAQVFNFVGHGTGILGGIQITAHNLGLRNGTFIAGNSFASQVAENIQISIDGHLTLAEGSVISADALGPAKAADLIIRARDILIADGSSLSSGTFSSGAGGEINLSAQSLTIQNGGTISTATAGTAPSAVGGSIIVNTTDHVTMTDGASITASSTGPGKAGNIDITATNGFTMQNSTITTEAGQAASGGNIKVTTAPSATVLLQNNSRISASVADGPGGGGNITIDPQYVILQDSQILAQAKEGQGGTITITTNLFLPDAFSLQNVNADSGRPDLNGTVTIQSPISPASGQIQPLGNQPLEATSLLNQHCAALAGGEFSSFTVSGRDSLPAEPGSWLASPLVAFGAGEALRGKGMTLGASLAGGGTLLSLRQIAPAGFLTQAFAQDWSAGCTS